MSILPDDAELALLLACCRASPTAEDLAEVRKRAEVATDWPRFLRLVRRHQVAPLAAETLQLAGVEHDPETTKLAERRRWNVRRTLELAREQGQILGALRQSGVVAVPYKGLALSESLYGGLDRRGAGDLDFLIQPEDFIAAEKVLLSRNYQPSYEPRGADVYDRAYTRKADLIGVELHWLLKSACAGEPRPVPEFWPLLVPTRVAGKETLGFPAELLLVLLVEHGTRHAWENLKWLCDVAELLRSQPDLDWGQVDRLTRPDARRALSLTLLLAHTALAVPLPPHRLPALHHRDICAMGRRLAASWSEEKTPNRGVWSRWVDSMALTEGFGRRCGATIKQIGAAAWPSSRDREMVALPPWLAWAYPGVRAVRVGLGFLRSRLRKKDQSPP